MGLIQIAVPLQWYELGKSCLTELLAPRLSNAADGRSVDSAWCITGAQ